jgi:transketolase
MSVLAPADPVETQWATQALVEHEGPCYLRLGRGGEAPVHPATREFRWGQAIEMRSGGDVLLLSCGGVLGMVMAAAEELARQGISARVMSVHTICPLDREAIVAAASACGKVLSVEEHGLGGLGTVVAEALAESGVRAVFRPMRLGPEPLQVAGSQAYLRNLAGLSVDSIVEAVRQMGR